MADDYLAQGIAAVKTGQVQEASILLKQAIEQNPNDERGWGWLYNVSSNDGERLTCINEILRINPNNEKARQHFLEISTRIEKMYSDNGLKVSETVATDQTRLVTSAVPKKNKNYSRISKGEGFILIAFLLVAIFLGINIIKIIHPVYGTMRSPFPFGEEASLNNKANGQHSDWTLQVLDVIRGYDANKIIHNSNMFNGSPPAGASWMLIKVKVTLKSGDALSLNAYDISVVSGGQFFSGLQFVCCTGDFGYPELNANIASPGTSVVGWVIRPVLINDEKPLLALNINSFNRDLDKGLFFALSR